MPGGVRWLSGRPEVQRAVDGWRAGAIPGEVLRDNARRRLARIAESGAGDLLVKHFRVGSGRHAFRETWKARLGRSPAAREYRALGELIAKGVAVPAPLALGELPEGDRILVMSFLPGVTLEEILTRPRSTRTAALAALGAQVRRLHEAGYVHRDLHGHNLVFSADGPFLLDLQRAGRSRSTRARLQDLGDLDYSLWGRASLADRLRIRSAALALSPPFGPEQRATLAAVGEAARRRAFAHGRSRTRRALRPGRRYARLHLDGEHGMRVRDVAENDITGALAAHREALAVHREALPVHREALEAGDDRVLEADGRSRITAVRAGEQPVIVKEVLPRGIGRVLADAVRGSPARRAWCGGHGLLARGVGSARPLAFVERRRFGAPLCSLLVLERLEGPDALEASRIQGEATLEALVDLLDALHRREVDHGDLKATNVFVGDDASPVPRLIDLEGVRFPRRLGEARRLTALVQLNASLPDEVPARLRRRALARYLAIHPFEAGPRATLRSLVEQSLARRHRWSGADCDQAGLSSSRR